MNDGWKESARAWIEAVGTDGDWGRKYVLDAPMIGRVAGRGFSSAIDIGCGEGRFCRMMKAQGISVVGIDPTAELIAQAQHLDPGGDYRIGRAEALNMRDRSFDLAVSYLSLIDIPDTKTAIQEIYRLLRPGGTFLLANLQSFNTAGDPSGWTGEADGTRRFYIDHYMDERVQWVTWSGVRVQNWHRPLSIYMDALLQAGFILRHFAEPEPSGAPEEQSARYRRAPYFLIMEWQKPDESIAWE